MKAKLFIIHHKNSHLIRDEVFEPIQVGDGPALDGIQARDNQGNNISNKNNRYCELTALYWAWKNSQDLDYIGLFHYRRFLDFGSTNKNLDACGVLRIPSFTTDFTTTFGLNAQAVLNVIQGYEFILPKKWSVRRQGFRNIRDHYVRSPHHFEADLTRCRTAISICSPEYLASWDSVLRSHAAWFNNIIICRTSLLNKYCEWLFPILDVLDADIPFETYNQQESRVIGYLAERLLNVWLEHFIHHNPSTRILELNRIFVDDPRAKVWDPPMLSTSQVAISVVIASDNNYAPHLGALLVSIFHNLRKGSVIDLLILDGGISSTNKSQLERLVPSSSSVHFIPMGDEFTTLFTHMHFSRATFYRLILDQVLITRERVIYIDCDTIVLGDLGELWSFETYDEPIAAVHDYIMEHFCKSKTLSADFSGSLPALHYLQQYVQIPPEKCGRYFQAGVLILNLRRLRQLNLGKTMINDLLSRKYWFLDQDVLNKYFCGSYVVLPAEWNLVNCGDDIYRSLNKTRLSELRKAFSQPKLIHYAGYEAKPWINPSANMGEYYFYYLRQTFWYEEVLRLRHSHQAKSKVLRITLKLKVLTGKILRNVWRKLPWRFRHILNPAAYSLRRFLNGG